MRFHVATTLLLGVVWDTGHCAAATPPNPSEAVSFSYEVSSHLASSPAFPDGKTDYKWVDVQSAGNQVRLYLRTVVQSDPRDPTVYTATELESYAHDDDTVLTCQSSVELRSTTPPSSIDDAKALYSQRGDGKLQRRWYFKSVEGSVHDHMLQGMAFLGMTPDGPLSAVSTASPQQVGGRDVYIYRSDQGVEYRYEYDPEVRLYTHYSITSDAASDAQKSYHIDAAALDAAAGDGVIALRTTATHETPGAPPLVITNEHRIFDLRFEDVPPLVMTMPPGDGDRVDSLDTPQIRYEWRDGRIAKRIDPILDADGEYVGSSRRFGWVIAVNVLFVLVLLVIVYVRKKWLLMAVAAAGTLLSVAGSASASSPYCGVYSVAWAGQSLGLTVDIEALIDPEYISSQSGSTGKDLVRAAESIGLKATLLAGLGRDGLNTAQSPLILHAAPLGTHAVYEHWILFLGFDEAGSARVIDGRGGVATCSKEDLLARWDGIAIAVRRPDMPATRRRAQAWATKFRVSCRNRFSIPFSFLVLLGALATAGFTDSATETDRPDNTFRPTHATAENLQSPFAVTDVLNHPPTTKPWQRCPRRWRLRTPVPLVSSVLPTLRGMSITNERQSIRSARREELSEAFDELINDLVYLELSTIKQAAASLDGQTANRTFHGKPANTELDA